MVQIKPFLFLQSDLSWMCRGFVSFQQSEFHFNTKSLPLIDLDSNSFNAGISYCYLGYFLAQSQKIKCVNLGFKEAPIVLTIVAEKIMGDTG